jgi:hypothetical protein
MGTPANDVFHILVTKGRNGKTTLLDAQSVDFGGSLETNTG